MEISSQKQNLENLDMIEKKVDSITNMIASTKGVIEEDRESRVIQAVIALGDTLRESEGHYEYWKKKLSFSFRKEYKRFCETNENTTTRELDIIKHISEKAAENFIKKFLNFPSFYL